MNKFRRFLGRISAETYLKIDYFGSEFPKIAKRSVSLELFLDRGGKTGNAKLMGSLSNLDRVFVPEISIL